MTPTNRPRRLHLAAWPALACLAVFSPIALAHDTKAGELTIDHAYSTPTPGGVRTGAVYFRGISNGGKVADRLVSARTSVADSVEIHRMTKDGDIMRMRAIDAVDLPPGTEVQMRHTGDLHLMLIGLKAPLKEGDTYSLWLRFARAGEHKVDVWVQKPRQRPAHEHHKH